MNKNLSVETQPTWRMFVALLAAFFVVSFLGVGIISGLQDEVDDLQDAVARGGELMSDLEDGQRSARSRGFASRAQSCMGLVIDNDRAFSLPAACTTPQVTAYYPLEICTAHFLTVSECGSKSNDPAL